MSARAMGSGTISFGLVAIPVKLYTTAESSKAIRFNQVHKSCGTRVKYQYYCPTDEKIVERDEIAKGYEVAKGQYVLFTPEELKALNPEPTNEIEIREFLPVSEVDPIYYEKSYYLGPDKGGARPYSLLAEAMKKTGRAAVAKYAARGKDHLVLLRPFEEGLIMQQLHYPEEIKAFSEVPMGDKEIEIKPAELGLAEQLIDQTATEEFQPTAYKDEVAARTWALIDRKIQGEEIVAEPEEAPKAKVIDLMEALKASLGDDDKAGRKPAKRASKTPAKKPTKRKAAARAARKG